jgi:hypothetical protein
MSNRVVTAVDASVDPDREADLVDGFRQLSQGDMPDGLVRSELLRGQDGAWRIQTTWKDIDSLMALRKGGKPHAAAELLDKIGAKHSHTWFTIEQSFEVA